VVVNTKGIVVSYSGATSNTYLQKAENQKNAENQKTWLGLSAANPRRLWVVLGATGFASAS
jgi:hypothetical protein